jgi:uncharacterized protein YqkB
MSFAGAWHRTESSGCRRFRNSENSAAQHGGEHAESLHQDSIAGCGCSAEREGFCAGVDSDRKPIEIEGWAEGKLPLEWPKGWQSIFFEPRRLARDRYSYDRRSLLASKSPGQTASRRVAKGIH